MSTKSYETIAPNETEFGVLAEHMNAFRDSGCRVLVSDATFNDFMVTSVSGHLGIARHSGPQHLGGADIGFRFDGNLMVPNAPLPVIGKSSYEGMGDLHIHIDHRDYFLYCNAEARDSRESFFSHNSKKYQIPLQWMLKTGAVIREE